MLTEAQKLVWLTQTIRDLSDEFEHTYAMMGLVAGTLFFLGYFLGQAIK